MFVHRLLISDDIKKTERIPLFIELRGKSPATLQPVELLGAWASAYRMDPRSLLRLLMRGRVFIVFEGFDEMAGVADANARLNHFRALWKFAFPFAKLLFTGRPNFFLDDTELRSALGIGVGIGSGPYCEHVRLAPFSLAQIENSLRWTGESTRQEIVALAQKDDKFLDVVARPSLLYIVGRLWGLPDFAPIAEGVDAAQVMGAFVRHCYKRQTEKHRGYPRFMVLTQEERSFFMDGLAAFMAANSMPNQLTQAQFEQAVSQLYGAMPDSLPKDASSADPDHGPLKKRLADRDDALDAVQTDVRTYGLLVRDYSRPNALKFPHKSFYEYLLGAFAAEYILDKESEYCAAIRSAVQLRIDSVVDVPQSLSFLGEIIARSQPSGDDAATSANRLFDAILVGPRWRLPRFARRLYIWSAFSRKRGLLVIVPMVTAIFLMLHFIFKGTERAPPGFTVIIVTLMTLIVALQYFLASRGWRTPLLWYCVARASGISDELLAREYGRGAIVTMRELAASVMAREKAGT